MTAPIREMPAYELYRVITDYEALQDGFLDRIDDLDTTLALPSFADGQVQKLLTKNPGKAITRKRDHRSASAKRTFGWESLGKMLKDTGLALVLVVDDARFGPVKEQLSKRKRKPSPSIVGQKRPTWLFTPKKASKMRAKWWNSLTEAQQKKHQRKAQKGQAAARRRKKSVALAAAGAPESGGAGVVRNACAAAMTAV
jgi:hypothetical protein